MNLTISLVAQLRVFRFKQGKTAKKYGSTQYNLYNAAIHRECEFLNERRGGKKILVAEAKPTTSEAANRVLFLVQLYN